jgi:hypothetical protein
VTCWLSLRRRSARRNDHGGDRPTDAPAAPTLPPRPPQRHAKRILLVEDHEDTNRSLTNLLRRRGYHVDLQSALDLSAKEEFDVLISDPGFRWRRGSYRFVRLILNFVAGQISLLLTLAHRGVGSAACCRSFILQRSLRVVKSRRVTKIENKIVAAPARVGFPVVFESVVRRQTHGSLIGPGRRENILVLRESE